MAPESNDWPAWVVGLAGVLTAAGAAARGLRRKPTKEDEMQVLRQRVSDLERRSNETDVRFVEVFRLLHGVDDGLGKCQSDVREALARLDERRKQ